MISVDGKGTVFPMKLKLKGGNHFNKDITKESFKKDLTNLTETNHQINMTLSILFQTITGLKAI